MILKYLGKKEWILFLISIATIVIQVFFDLQIPGYMNNITLTIENGASLDSVTEYGYLMLLSSFASIAASLITGVIIAYIASSLSKKLRSMVFNKVTDLTPGDMEGFSVASLVTRSTNDINQIQNFIGRAMQIVVKSPIMAVWAVVKISGGCWEWTAITVAGVLVLVVIIVAVMMYTMKFFRRIQTLTDGVNSNARESIVGLRTIRAYNADGFQARRYDKASEDLLRNNLSVFRATVPMFSATDAISNFLTIAIYWTGALLISAATDSGTQVALFSNMIVFSSYAIQVLMAFMMMTEVIRGYPRASVCSKRVEEVLDLRRTVVEGTFDSETPEKGTVAFENVTFGYPGSASSCVENIDFEIRPNETVAIVGPTGCGKSTLAKLMLRMFDTTDGSVRIDGIDVREYRSDALYSKISYVPQIPIIFNSTVRENVDYGKGPGESDDEKVWKALKIAQAEDFVRSYPEGLDANLLQQGRNISGGQKQRISIARAVCHDPEILILDDSFSALDFKTELSLREAISKELKDMTKIIITQRAGVTREADQILVMEDGRIIDKGSHDELLQRCQTYRDIMKLQFSEGS
jgi:ATP-binding cassette subfamily B protein